MTTDSALAQLRKVERVLKAFLNADARATIKTALIFTAVAADEGRMAKEYATSLHMPINTVWRNLEGLSGSVREDAVTPKRAFLVCRPNPADNRENQYFLNDAGKALVLSLTDPL